MGGFQRGEAVEQTVDEYGAQDSAEHAVAPQGQAERFDRTARMVNTMERYFGSCTNHRECEAACPKEISIDFIALMNRDYAKAQLSQRRLVGQRFP